MEKDSEEPEHSDDLKALLQEDLLVFGQHITKDYEIGDFIVRAVNDVSVEIKEGEFIVIVGPSGAGKTTLLNLIGGLDYPTKGKLYCFGVNITDMDAETLATWRAIHSGFVFQNYNLISTLTAVENIIFPMKIIGESLENARERAITLLEKMNLNERFEHLPFQLSAGEQQRVAIARALANDPPLILADEPTANLDKETSNFIENIFKELKDDERTIVIATHDDYLIDLADRIITFEDGKITKTLTQ
ncbi:MAG: ABC transporter ATP-binding protein [Promethearchaeia archaeon]